MELTIEQKKKLYSILSNTTPLTVEDRRQKTNSCILLVDGTNLFIRGWAATNSMNDNGDLVGGVVASLKSLGYAIKLTCCSRAIIVFDGIGGSLKRRQIFPEYKSGRKGKIRLNREYEELSNSTDEEKNCKKQYIKFVHYLQVLPVNLLSIDYQEADDVLAYLATDYFKDAHKVYIMSSDKDFLQLCTGNINVYSPTKKRIYGEAEVLAEYNIHPNNFVLYRAMDGDNSDNIDGIEGAGPKTIVKQFPWLNEERQHTVDDLIHHAVNLRNKYKVMENVASNKTILDRNVALMQLRDTALTTIAQLHCNDCLKTEKIPRLNRGSFYNLVREDMIDGVLPNHVDWLDQCFGSLDSVIRSE
jgi:DNA polymerase-1